MQGTSRIRSGNRLTALQVLKVTEPGILEDGAGLRLVIGEGGGKHWVVRVTVAGKRISRGLGTFPGVTLIEARKLAENARRAARDGKDAVVEVKRQHRRDGLTFRDAFNRYFEEVKRPTLKVGRFAERWPESMEVYVYPHIGDRPVAEVTPAEIIDLLQPIWHTKRETATRVLQRMAVAFQSAIVRGDRMNANPCQGVRDELGRSRPKVQHRRALAWELVPEFVVDLEHRPRVTPASKLALLLVVYTACRSEEVRGACWNEVNFAAREWTVPAIRMKMKREHVVPLPDAALAILKRAEALRRQDTDLIFPSRVGSMLSDNTLSKLMRDAEIDGTPHGFRTSFKVWASENQVRDEVSEAVLAHGDPDKVRAAYRRTTFYDDRKLAMQAWSEYLRGAREEQQRTSATAET
jgi:integrase